MQKCKITITTMADGAPSDFSANGEMELKEGSAKLRYEDKGTIVDIALLDGRFYIKRVGEYTLSLCLENGRKTEGKLGIFQSEGVVHTFTEKLEYSIKKGSLLLFAHYDLIIGEEVQKMQIRLFAKE
jgi:hypothetical protein